ncbi:hypothetical protein PTKIN_Ptkin12aG0040800 [Pterospermum kingtungense]
MANFSVGIEDGEGPSNRAPSPKRPRVAYAAFSSDSEDGHSDSPVYRRSPESEGEEASEGEGEEEESEHEEEVEEEEGGGEGEESGAEEGAMSPETTRDDYVSFTLTDPEALDCPVCREALTTPVYQCDNGHIACSTCCLKISKKCQACARPIGYSRCRAIENVLESVNVSCQNSKYGCREAFSYSMKREHGKKCPFAPCSCPFSGCNFKGSSKQLHGHFGNKIEHRNSATRFQYDRLVSFALGVDQKFLILREERDGSLFILYNKVETLGNALSLSRIGPSTDECFYYELVARAGFERSSLRYASFTKSIPEKVDNPPSVGFLLVPSQFFSIARELKMELRVYHHAHAATAFIFRW